MENRKCRGKGRDGTRPLTATAPLLRFIFVSVSTQFAFQEDVVKKKVREVNEPDSMRAMDAWPTRGLALVWRGGAMLTLAVCASLSVWSRWPLFR